MAWSLAAGLSTTGAPGGSAATATAARTAIIRTTARSVAIAPRIEIAAGTAWCAGGRGVRHGAERETIGVGKWLLAVEIDTLALRAGPVAGVLATGTALVLAAVTALVGAAKAALAPMFARLAQSDRVGIAVRLDGIEVRAAASLSLRARAATLAMGPRAATLTRGTRSATLPLRPATAALTLIARTAALTLWPRATALTFTARTATLTLRAWTTALP